MSIQDRIAAAKTAASQTAIDLANPTAGGGFARRLLPEGYALGRLVELIEFGNQPQQYMGKAKDPKPEVQLGFALYGKKVDPTTRQVIDAWENEDGTPYIERMYPMALDNFQKARAVAIFSLLNWEGKAHNFWDLLGQAFLVKIIHKDEKKDGKPTGKKRSMIDPKGFLPPINPVDGSLVTVPVPEDKFYRIFSWDAPTMADWDALKIDGKDDATDEEKLKANFVQNKIVSALNFPGSPLDQLLQGGGVVLPNPEALRAAAQAVRAEQAEQDEPAPQAAPSVVPAAPGVASAVPLAPTVPAVPATPAAVPAVAPPAPAVPSSVPAVGNASPAPQATPTLTFPSNPPAIPGVVLPS